MGLFELIGVRSDMKKSGYMPSVRCAGFSNQRGAIVFILWLVLGITSGSTQAASCPTDGEDYRRLALQSLANSNLAQAQKRLKLANANGCATAEAYIQLGRAQAATSEFANATESFQLAQAQADTADVQALAIGRYAEALAKLEGPNSDSLDLIQFARRQHSSAPQWMTDLALQLDTALLDDGFSRDRLRSFTESKMGRLSMANIAPLSSRTNPDVEELSGPQVGGNPSNNNSYASASSNGGGSGNAKLDRPAGARSAEKSLSFRVNFARGSSQLDADQIEKVRELAEGMVSDELRSNSFELIGHTDVVGGEGMNQRLSEQRSAAVYQLLIALQPTLANRLSHKGRGESEPLYANATSSTEHFLNRRVQVVVK